MRRRAPLRTIDVRKLKRFVQEYLPSNWILRELLLGEEDMLSTIEFCVKMPIWLKLLKKKGDDGS